MMHGANVVKISDQEKLSDSSTLKSASEGLSPEEKARKERKHKLQQAVLYGKSALQDASKKSAYQQVDRENAFDVAFADFLNAPSIDSIDLSGYNGRIGSRISVTVVDDFQVEAVYLKIQNADGSIADEGYAEPGLFRTEWIFTANQDNPVLKGDKITILATDLPGNDSRMEYFI
jgi:hypothetical protein